MYNKLFGVFILVFSMSAFAGDAENISACVAKAKEFAGVTVDPFAAKYDSNVVAFSSAKWRNVYCEVKLAQVLTLDVNGKNYIYKFYAGKEAYDLSMELQDKTDEAINQMESRISLLKQRASQASVSLQKPNPNAKWLTKYVDEGIQKSLGNVGNEAVADVTKP